MRRPFILLALLSLAGCVDSSASYEIDGSDHALTLHAQQDRFWSREVALHLIASRLPGCQRQLDLGTLPAAGLDLQLFGNGDVYTLRSGDGQWQVAASDCTLLAPAAQAAPGQPLGSFHLDGKRKLVFEPAAANPAG